MPRASGASAADERACVRTLTGRHHDQVALLAAYVGGDFFAILVAAAATAMFYEWTRIVRGWGIGWYVSGFFYAVLPALALLWVRERDAHGLALLIWAFIVTWSTDIGAYFAGRRFGKHKLAPSVSPNKTVEGLYGGMAAATLFGGRLGACDRLGKPLLALSAPVRDRGADGRPVRKLDEAPRGDQGQRHLAARAWRRARPARRAGAGGCADRRSRS